MSALFWFSFFMFAAYIVHLRFKPQADEHCEFCSREIDTSRQSYVQTRYAIELGVVRAYDYWIFCSDHCELLYLDYLAQKGQK